MAMPVQKESWRHYPPPIGKGRMSAKAGKKQLSRFTQRSVEEQIRSQFNVSGGVVTSIEVAIAARKAVAPLVQDNQEDDVPFDPAEEAHASGGDTPPPKGDTEWYPSWQFDSKEPAWFNVMRNAYIMKPLGRKFIPDPAYNGTGECPLPQRTALHCEIKWNNVVSFEEARDEAEQAAQRKIDNSMRSRGGDLFTPITRKYAGPKSAGQPQISGPPAPSPATQQVPAANQETHLSSEEMGMGSTLAGDTADPRDIHLQSLWYYPVNVALHLHSEGYARLSNSYWAWMKGEEVYVGKNICEMYSVETRMDEMEFYYKLEDGCDFLLPQDMVSPQYLADSAVEAIFDSIPSAATNGFLEYEAAELSRFHYQVECSRRNLAAINPLKVGLYFGLGRVIVLNDAYPMNDWPTIWEIAIWEDEERDGLSALGVSRLEESAPLPPVAANEKPVAHEDIDFTKIGAKLRLTEEPELWYLKWLSSNQESVPVNRQHNVLPHYLGVINRQVEGSLKNLHRSLVKAICLDAGVTTTTPWVQEVDLPPPVKPPGKIARKVSKFVKRASHWWNKPVLFTGGKQEDEVSDEYDPNSDPRVIAAAQAAASHIMLESAVARDDREAIQWLQDPDRPVEEASSPEFVGRVIHAIQDEEENELYSPAGIIIGKKSRFEQVNSGGSILLLNAKVPPKVA